jgi:4-methyl-5(b-hydroxyethyl)-thiazole monophosphate biosynthesis
MVTVFLAEGFEEIEAITPIDVLRRGGVEVRLCSITDSLTVCGAHGIPILCDTTISELEGTEEVMLLPGGMPGTLHLKQCSRLRFRLLEHAKQGGYLAAICAAPTVLGELGLLKGRRATCYPGMESGLMAGECSEENVVIDGKIVTSRGAGTAFDFSLALLTLLKGKEAADSLARGMCYRGEEK